jgi:large subunit ribosomal protein L20
LEFGNSLKSMAHIKRGTVSRRKHNKLLLQVKGYRGTKNSLIKDAHEAVLHAGEYAFHGRKLRKRDMRRAWITRINGALDEMGHSYSTFINGMTKKNIKIDRKILANLVSSDPETFKTITQKVFDK